MLKDKLKKRQLKEVEVMGEKVFIRKLKQGERVAFALLIKDKDETQITNEIVATCYVDQDETPLFTADEVQEFDGVEVQRMAVMALKYNAMDKTAIEDLEKN